MLTDIGSINELLFSALTIIAYVLLFTGAVFILRALIDIVIAIRTKHELLEITPQAFQDKPLQATENLFVALHSLGRNRSFFEKLISYTPTFSVEIASTKQTGIRFLVCCPADKSSVVEKLITSYVPEAKVKRVSDYYSSSKKRIFAFKQSKHYALPLKKHEDLFQDDPISYVTATMSKLKDGEQMSLQIVLKPVQLRSAEILRNKILRNEQFLPGSKHDKTGIGMKIAHLIRDFLFWVADAISMVNHYEKTSYNTRMSERDMMRQMNRMNPDTPARTLSYFEHELVESVSSKLQHPLFRANIRAIVVGDDKQRIKSHKKVLASALGLYSVEKYQSLKLKRRVFGVRKKLLEYLASKRMLSFSPKPNYFATSELASLYHFPHSEGGKTDDMVKSLSKTLPAPISLKSGKKLDVLIGENKHHGETTVIGLTVAERQRHMYIIGGTGNGKTTLIKHQIMQDIVSGKGLAVVDPHGDLAEEVLGLIPGNRMQDVVYINPDDLERPVGVNLLELPKGLSGNDLLREKDLVTESTVSVLRKIFSEDDSGGHRIEYVLRNTIQTALTLEKANLFTIFRLLNDKKFRNQTVKNLKDEDLRNFWKQELGKAGDMQRVKMAAGITSKIGRFLFSASARGMLEQDESTIDFEKIMDEQKILICNFSKGLLGEDTSALFGITVLAKLQIASLKRARQSQADRKPYYLYVDEFQNFATMGFVQMLSEARKYKLFLIMAEQSTQQQEQQRLVDIILANVGTVVAFRSGSPKDEQLIQPLFTPYVEPGEIANLPAYNFYAKINAVDTQEPMSGETIVVNEAIDNKVAVAAKDYSRKKYGTERRNQNKKPKSIAFENNKKNRTSSIAKSNQKNVSTRKARKAISL